MAKLVLKAGSGAPEIPLDTATLTIGRRADNRLRLEDSFASSRHATISLRSRAWWLEDHASSNGTFLNGVRVSGLKRLKGGDRITIGKQDYEFDETGADAGAGPGPPLPAPEPAGRRSQDHTRPVPPGVNLARLAATDVRRLDAMVGSIRAHRDREQVERDARHKKLRDQWARMLNYAEEVKERVSADPRVKYFSVSRRANDILLRFQRSADAPVEMLYFSLEHPEQKGHALQGIWFRRSGEADRCLAGADEAALELGNEVAFLIA